MAPHILLVEDDDIARQLLAKILEGAGYRLTEAADGEQALAQLTSSTFDIVISDIQMRIANGLDVLHAAKQQPYQPAVILLTGYGSLQTSLDALRGGAADYLLKPCSPTDLLATITKTLERRDGELRQRAVLHSIAQSISQLQTAAPAAQPNEAPRFLELGALHIDFFRHTVLFGGQIVHLTPIEYELLCCLAEAQGRALTYEALVWRTHGYATSEAEAQLLIKPHIHNLRHKLDPDYVVNVRGIGYRLSVPEA